MQFRASKNRPRKSHRSVQFAETYAVKAGGELHEVRPPSATLDPAQSAVSQIPGKRRPIPLTVISLNLPLRLRDVVKFGNHVSPGDVTAIGVSRKKCADPNPLRGSTLRRPQHRLSEILPRISRKLFEFSGDV